jgi:hypothetical protein
MSNLNTLDEENIILYNNKLYITVDLKSKILKNELCLDEYSKISKEFLSYKTNLLVANNLKKGEENIITVKGVPGMMDKILNLIKYLSMENEYFFTNHKYIIKDKNTFEVYEDDKMFYYVNNYIGKINGKNFFQYKLTIIIEKNINNTNQKIDNNYQIDNNYHGNFADYYTKKKIQQIIHKNIYENENNFNGSIVLNYYLDNYINIDNELNDELKLYCLKTKEYLKKKFLGISIDISLFGKKNRKNNDNDNNLNYLIDALSDDLEDINDEINDSNDTDNHRKKKLKI